jgi:hypothetical protein
MLTIKLLVDNSAISEAACDRAYQLTVIQGLRKPDDAVLILGKAFHRLAQRTVNEDPKDQAGKIKLVQEVCDEYSIYDQEKMMRMSMAFNSARVRLPPVLRRNNGTPYTETKFDVNYKTIERYGRQYEIHLVGTIDYLGYKDCLQMVDYKSFAGRTPSDKAKEYAMKFQLSFYGWMLYRYSRELIPDLVNLHPECDAALMLARYAIMPHNLPMPSLYIGNPQHFNKPYFEEVQSIIDNAIEEMMAIHNLGDRLAVRNGMTNDKCKYCAYVPGCISRNESREIEFFNTFERAPYDPLSFN